MSFLKQISFQLILFLIIYYSENLEILCLDTLYKLYNIFTTHIVDILNF